MLSKKEYKYRSKIIAENHLKKRYQKDIDRYIDCSYKQLYYNKEKLNFLIDTIAAKEMCEAIWRVGDSAKNTTNALRELLKVLASAQKITYNDFNTTP